MSTQEDLAVSYDVSNDFFRLWLDERMNYSCALFLHDGDTLEQAQVNKLAWFHDRCRITADSRVLDIGCGWGANIEYLVKDKGVAHATGITLSRAQYEEVERRLVPGMEAHCISYTEYEPAQKFDAIISIGMFEHLATPEQARSGDDMFIYRDYFRRARDWSVPGAWFGLQSVIGGRIPRDRDALRELAWATYAIFPGAISPRLERIIAAASPYWEVMEVHTRREHYQKTAAAWLERLEQNAGVIRERWGDKVVEDYRRYLTACVTSFAGGYQSLVQLALRRI